jgi:hypothetical protein
MNFPMSLMSWWEDLQPHVLFSCGFHFESVAGSMAMPSHAVDPTVESMNNLCTFMSFCIRIAWRSFRLRAFSSFLRSISFRYF